MPPPNNAEPAAPPRQLIRVLARLLAVHPSWVLAHAQAYADLAMEQARLSSAAWQRRLALQLVAAVFAALGMALAGVALMLWATTAPLPPARMAVLVLVPLLPVLAALLLMLAARGLPQPPGLASLRQQWQADLALLREATPP